MKKLILFVLVIFIFMTSIAQLQMAENRYYSNNKLYNGSYEQIQSDGNCIVMNFKNGMLNGISEVYNTNNELIEVRSYSKNKFEGIWITYNNGVKIAEANYKNHKKHGKWYIWSENGVMRFEMEYDLGKKVGAWKQWDENGILINEKSYKL